MNGDFLTQIQYLRAESDNYDVFIIAAMNVQCIISNVCKKFCTSVLLHGISYKRSPQKNFKSVFTAG